MKCVPGRCLHEGWNPKLKCPQDLAFNAYATLTPSLRPAYATEGVFLFHFFEAHSTLPLLSRMALPAHGSPVWLSRMAALPYGFRAGPRMTQVYQPPKNSLLTIKYCNNQLGMHHRIGVRTPSVCPSVNPFKTTCLHI